MTIPDMTTGSYRKPRFKKKKSAFFTWSIRLIIACGVLLAFMFVALSLVSGSNPDLEEALEYQLSEALDKQVTFERLINIELFPTIKFEFQGLDIRPYPPQEISEDDKQEIATDNASNIDDESSDNSNDNSKDNKSAQDASEVIKKDEEDNKEIVELDQVKIKKQDQKIPHSDVNIDEPDPTVIRIDKFSFKSRFWDVLLRRKVLQDIEIQNLSYSNSKSSTSIRFDYIRTDPSAFIKGDGTKLPGLSFLGSHNGRPLSGQLALNVGLNANQNIVRYDFRDISPFQISYDLFTAAGKLNLLPSDNIHIDNMIVVHDEKPLVTSDIKFLFDTPNQSIDVDITFGQSHVAMNVQENTASKTAFWEADIRSDQLVLNDLVGDDSKMNHILAAIAQLGIDNDHDRSDETDLLKDLFHTPYANLSVNLKALKIKDKNIGHAQFDIIKQYDYVALENLKGEVGQGQLDGFLKLHNRNTNIELDLLFDLSNLAHHDLQEALGHEAVASGEADIRLNLKGEGIDFTSLVDSLNGHFHVIGGQGKMTTRFLDKWGRGLIKAIVPKSDIQELTLNSALVDFEFENGIGTSQALFIDTPRVKVVGKGTLNLPKSKIDISLNTQPKELAVLDVTPAVIIKGDIASPSIRPSTLSLGKKVGSLLLGTINPAVWAVALNDVGVTDKHPCFKAIGELQTDKPQLNEKNQVSEKKNPDKPTKTQSQADE